MTYIEYLNEFNQWLESGTLPGNSQLMYFKFLNLFNRAGWPEYVQVDNLRLMSMIGTKTIKTAIQARDKLVDAGFIVYGKGSKGCPNRYKLGIRCKKNTLNDTLNDTLMGTLNDTLNDTLTGTLNDTHIKTKTKTKTKNIPPCIPPDDFSPALSAAFANWLQYKREKRQDYKPTGLQSLVAKVQKAAETYGEQAVIDLIGECMANNWQGIIFDRLERGAARNPSGKNGRNIFMDMLREESESGAQ